MQMEKQMFGKQIVGLHLPCACPASRQEKKPGVRDGRRDISGLMDGGSYMSEARSWCDTSPCVVDGRQDMAAVFILGKGRWPVIGN